MPGRCADSSARLSVGLDTADTGITSMQRILRARIERARELLERTDLSVTQSAERSGLGADANLRRPLGSMVGAFPTAYRRTFRDQPPLGMGLSRGAPGRNPLEGLLPLTAAQVGGALRNGTEPALERSHLR